MGKIHTLHQLWRYMGPRWLAYRFLYAASLRTGQLRRQLPTGEWDAQRLGSLLGDSALAEPDRYLDYRLNAAPPFFFSHGDREKYQPFFAAWDGAEGLTPGHLSDDLLRGRLRYFESVAAQSTFPPDWHANPFTGQKVAADNHWSQIGDFSNGDIKIVWEPSRFTFVYALVRSYWRTGDERYAEAFWQLVEDWRAHNPPQRGPNWKCGQEISFRVMAWCYGLYGFLGAAPTDPARVAALAQMIAVSGRRIEVNLDYALSQRNNHGISEGLGLWTIGTLFPELSHAAKWREIGRRGLETQGQELIYVDGAFAQHSLNYQRLMLHDYLWALRLGDLANRPFSPELKQRVGDAGALLFQLQDEDCGRVPNYGHNDGALILPLNNCDYTDYRPVTQATHYLRTGTRCHGDGAWDEDLLWLFGPDAVGAPVKTPPRVDLGAAVGGYYTLRSANGFAFVRCATFRDRPGQADVLHADLWWRGENVAIDAGTYSYNAPAPWDNSLASTAYHNTVTVDGLDQMDRAGKFLWVPWLRGEALSHRRSPLTRLSYWEGAHDGYRRLKSPTWYRRGILRIGDEWWLVIDTLVSEGEHSYRLHWLLADMPNDFDVDECCLTLHTPAGPYSIQMAASSPERVCTLIRADEHSPRGWHSPYYNLRRPALSIDLTALAGSLTFCTLFGPDKSRVRISGDQIHVETQGWQGTVRLRKDASDRRPIIGSASFEKGLEKAWHVA